MLPRFSPDYNCKLLAGALFSRTKTLDFSSFFSQPLFYRYGRSGLYLLTKTLIELTGKKRVVLPSYTCVVVANAVRLAGGEPFFVDSDPNSFLVSQKTLSKAVDDQTCLVIPTHLFGMSVDTDELLQEYSFEKNRTFVLQDCAHSFFAKDSRGRNVAELGDGALFGMNISKLANGVRAGALIVRNEEIRARLLKMNPPDTRGIFDRVRDYLFPRAYAVVAALMFHPALYSLVSWLSKNTSMLKSQTDYYDENKIDLPPDFLAPLGEFEKRVLLRSLVQLDTRIEKRRETAKVYSEILSRQPGQFTVPVTFDSGWTWSHFPLAVPPHKRDGLRVFLESKFGVEIGIIVDYSVSDLGAYRKLGFLSTPRALELSKSVVNLPLTFREGISSQNDWRERATRIAEATLAFLS
jgi:perosamine synthetase